eukprot:455374-Pelagomonas_calceolata.AAC.1
MSAGGDGGGDGGLAGAKASGVLVSDGLARPRGGGCRVDGEEGRQAGGDGGGGGEEGFPGAEGEAGAHTLTAPGLLVGVVVLLLVGGDGVHRPTLDAGEDQAEELMRMQREHARLEVEGQ